MPSRLGQHPLTRINQKHTKIAVRCAGRHIARVLHMSGRIGNDELPPGRREIAIRHIDRDALLALGLKAVDEERQIDLRPRVGIGRLDSR